MKPFEPEILRSKVSVFVDLYLKGETIKLQERLLRQREREAIERRSQHRYRSLLDSMPQCVWAAERRGRDLLLEPRRAQLLRRQRGSDHARIVLARGSSRRAAAGRGRLGSDDRGAAGVSARAAAAPIQRRRVSLAPGAHGARAQRAERAGGLDRDGGRHRRSQARGGGAATRGHPPRRLPVGGVARAAHAADVAEAGGLEPRSARAAQPGRGAGRAPEREAGQDRGPGRTPASVDRRSARRLAHRLGAAGAGDRRRRSVAARARGGGALPGRSGARRLHAERRGAGPGGGQLGSQPPGAGADQHGHQRAEVRAGEAGRGHRRGRRLARAARRARPGRGHRCRGSAADLRSLRARVIDAQLRRHWPGPVDRARDRARAPGRRAGRQRARRRRDVHRRAALIAMERNAQR